MSKPLAADYLVFAFFLLAPLVDWLWLWPRAIRAIGAGVRGARAAHYWATIVFEWIPTLYVLGLWLLFRRRWDALYLGRSSLLRLGCGLAFALAVIVFFWNQQRTVLARPKLIERVRQKLSFADPWVPRTGAERYQFWLVAITAGICEEVLYRGFLLGFLRGWFGFLGGWAGLTVAIVVSSIVFGWGHMYLGYQHAPRTVVVGVFLAVVVVLTKSLWPAILIHAAIDFSSGELGFAVHRAGAGNLGEGKHESLQA